LANTDVEAGILENNRKAAAVSASVVFSIALATGLYWGAGGSSAKKAGSLFFMSRPSSTFIEQKRSLTFLIVAMI
jgi:hypothetical protein